MTVTQDLKEKIESQVCNFFSAECEIDRSQISGDTNIIENLGGDSLMFFELITGWKKEYSLDIELRQIGKYLTKNPAVTIDEIVKLACLMIEKGSDFAV